MEKKELILWWKCKYQFPRLSPYHGFYCIFPYCGNLWGNPHISHMLKYTIGGNRMGKKHLYCGESMIIDFPDFPHTIGFVAFSRTVGNLWGNLCTSHIMTSFNCFLCYLVDPNMILMALYSCKELIHYFFPLNHNFTEPVFSQTSSFSGMVNKMNHIPTSSSTGKCHEN